MTHFRAPYHELKMDRTLSKIFQEHVRRWVSQDVGIAFPNRNQRGANLVDITSISDTDWNAKPHAGIAICPIRHWRIDELRVRDDHGDVIVCPNYCAPCPDEFHLTCQTSDFDPIADRDRALG